MVRKEATIFCKEQYSSKDATVPGTDKVSHRDTIDNKKLVKCVMDDAGLLKEKGKDALRELVIY